MPEDMLFEGWEKVIGLEVDEATCAKEGSGNFLQAWVIWPGVSGVWIEGLMPDGIARGDLRLGFWVQEDGVLL